MFQFTHPVWGATSRIVISLSIILSFNSRTPCGVRRERLLRVGGKYVFQFTHPVWGATGELKRSQESYVQFQFTHPVWGATSGQLSSNIGQLKFQFTHPVWGATIVVVV